ncbi:MAG: M56 family metallopeptidase [Candidatus Zixiibacteriota bacterium]
MNWLEQSLLRLADYPQLSIYLLTFLVKGSLALLLSVLTIAAIRSTAPAKRSLVIRLSLAAVVLFPVLPLIFPGLEIKLTGFLVSNLRGTISSISVDQSAVVENSAGGLAMLPWAVWLTLSWLAGVMAVSSRVALGTFLSSRIVEGAVRVEDGPIMAVANQLKHDLDIKQTIRVAISGATDSPFVFGVFRPTVMLPVAANSWSADSLRMIFLHELAHIKRMDVFWVYVSFLAAALYWFNPLVWILRKKSTIESDKVCDDYVICSGTDKVAYAEHLLGVIRALRRDCASVPIAVGMARKTQMEGRLMSILSDRKRIAGVRRSLVVWTTVVTLLLVMPLAIVEIQAADPAQEKQSQKEADLKAKQMQAKASNDDSVHSDDAVLAEVMPVMIYQEAPEYPEDAKKAGLTGSVWVRVLVDSTGAAREAMLSKSSGNEQLDNAALAPAYKNKFKPGLKDGKPVVCWVTYKVVFALDDADTTKEH